MNSFGVISSPWPFSLWLLVKFGVQSTCCLRNQKKETRQNCENYVINLSLIDVSLSCLLYNEHKTIEQCKTTVQLSTFSLY